MTDKITIQISYKDYIRLSQISGMARGLAHIETMNDYNKDGVVSGIKEIITHADSIIENATIIEHGKPSKESELRAMMNDPKYWRDKDPEHIKRVTEGFKSLYNE